MQLDQESRPRGTHWSNLGRYPVIGSGPDCKSGGFGLWGFKSLPAHYTEVVKCNNDTVLEGESLWSPGENIQIRSKIATWFCNAGLFS